MKITLLSEDSLRVEGAAGPLTIEAESAEMTYSPFHMLASGLAACMFSVVHAWAEHAGLDAAALSIGVRWSFAEQPHRVGRYEVTLGWVGLAEPRRQAAQRAASLCAVHATLSHPPQIDVSVEA